MRINQLLHEPEGKMTKNDIKFRRKSAGFRKQADLVPHLPLLPTGSKITVDLLGRYERGEVPMEPEVYASIIDAIERVAANRNAA